MAILLSKKFRNKDQPRTQGLNLGAQEQNLETQGPNLRTYALLDHTLKNPGIRPRDHEAKPRNSE